MSNSLNITATVSLSGGGTLALEDPDNGYEIVSYGGGGRVWERDTVGGRYVHGRTLTSKKLSQRTAVLVIRILGVNWSQVQARYVALEAALDQYEYLLTVTIEGVTKTHVCEAADIALANGDDLNKFEIMADMSRQTYTLAIPYHPTRTAL